MTARTRRLAVGLLALVAGLALGPRARADEFEEIPLGPDVVLDEALRPRARILPTPAGRGQGGYGYVTVELRNPTGKAHVAGLELYPTWGFAYGDRAPWRVRRTQRLAPGETATLHLPLVNLRGGAGRLRLTWDGRETWTQLGTGGMRPRADSLAVLQVGAAGGQDEAAWATYLEAQVGRVQPGRKGHTPAVRTRSPEQLPDRWALLSGFDLVIVDAGDPRLTAEHERLLVRYLAGGGHLLVFGLAATADGPLAALRQGAEARAVPGGGRAITTGYHGLGGFFLAAAPHPDGALDAWLTDAHGARSVTYAAGRAYATGLPTPFWLPLEIPGLGEVPVQLFFFLLLAFAIVVGPVSYLYFKRRKRLPMLLVTIPALGFSCTAVILLYGFFSEGFGVVAAARSLTVLDQRERTAATVMGRTLYAGLQPSSLTPAPDAFLLSGSFVLDGYDEDVLSRFHVDLDGGYRIDGGALPSRTPMPFVTAHVGRSRERLRFKRRPDGGFDVLSAPGLVPVLADGALLLRTADRASYRMRADGVLAPLPELGAPDRAAVLVLCDVLADLPLGAGALSDDEDPYGYGYRGGFGMARRSRSQIRAMASGSDALGTWLAGRLEDGLPPGSYLARVRRPPEPDDLGLDIEERAGVHLVLGYLDAEDVLDD